MQAFKALRVGTHALGLLDDGEARGGPKVAGAPESQPALLSERKRLDRTDGEVLRAPKAASASLELPAL